MLNINIGLICKYCTYNTANIYYIVHIIQLHLLYSINYIVLHSYNIVMLFKYLYYYSKLYGCPVICFYFTHLVAGVDTGKCIFFLLLFKVEMKIISVKKHSEKRCGVSQLQCTLRTSRTFIPQLTKAILFQVRTALITTNKIPVMHFVACAYSWEVQIYTQVAVY